MSKIPFAIALVSATFGLSLLTPANALTKADCRPLTADNARECCAAPNWKALIRNREEVICKRPEFSGPLATTTPTTTTPETPETPPGTEPPAEPPEQTVGINNGHGNLNQNAPGNSLDNNNAENSGNSGDGNSGSGGGGHEF